MKYLGTKDLSEGELLLTTRVQDHEVYTPKSYYNGLSFLKPGCPFWIKRLDSDTCDVLTFSEGENWEDGINKFLSKNE